MEDETIQQFTMIAEIDEGLARTMYKLGFRTMQDLIEANPQELAGIPGLGGTEKGNAIREAAQAAVEEVRRERIREAAKKTEPLTTRERLLFITGVGERTVELLEQKGYENVEAIAEEDVDKFAIRTGLGLKKAKSIIHGARQFLASEKTIMEELASQTSQRPIEAEVVLSQAAAEDAPEVVEAPENGADDDEGERNKINKLDEGW